MDNETDRRQLFLYHANAKGNGCAMGVELRPTQKERRGCVVMTFANQICQDLMFPRFDWDGAVEVKLYLVDVARVLQVFRGECESICDGKGIYIRSSASGYGVRYDVRHVIEPICGYVFEAYRVDASGEETSRRIALSSAEALALCLALENSMGILAFGK